MNESKSAESLDTNFLVHVHAEVHDHVDDVVVDQLLEQYLVVSEERNG